MNPLREIPPVNDILRSEALSGHRSLLAQPFAQALLAEILERTRKRLASGGESPTRAELTRSISQELAARLDEAVKPSLRRVINATGVVLHTNLGRAPLSQRALNRLQEVAGGYSNLEFDLETGARGKRDVHAEKLLQLLIGCEAAVVVNNNAAAVLLVLSALAGDGDVIASRGEQVEIGGSFRIPEVMARSGARLREVGTTNRTRIADYEQAIDERTRLLLRVHPSNFRIVGFTERPSLEEFAELGRRRGIPTYEDLGSGCLLDLTSAGVVGEPLVQEGLGAGVDILSFSGDKLLGGPQAGIIAGRRALVQRVRQSPWFRALRVDKLTLGVLESVLLDYLHGDENSIPAIAMLRAGEALLKERAGSFASRAGDVATPIRIESVVGGGSAPEAPMPSWGVRLHFRGLTENEVERRLRQSNPPVIARVADGSVILDLRTVSESEEDQILESLQTLHHD